MPCNCKKEMKFKDPSIDVAKLQPVLDKYKSQPGSLITILQKAQDLFGYLPPDLLVYISHEVGVKPAKTLGIATFYTQFRLEPVGKNLIMLCQGTACHVNGSALIEEAVTEHLGIKDGETTEDNLFTLNNVACLGCCSLSPVMMINGEAYGKLTPESCKKILDEISAREAGK